MPIILERRLKREAKRRGYGKRRTGAFVYGTLVANRGDQEAARSIAAGSRTGTALFGIFGRSRKYGAKRRKAHASYVSRAANRGHHAFSVSTLSSIERKRAASRRYYAAHKGEINAKRRAAHVGKPRRAPKTHVLSETRARNRWFSKPHKLRSIERKIEIGYKRPRRYSARRAALS